MIDYGYSIKTMQNIKNTNFFDVVIKWFFEIIK
jgi:hypothetical protein